MWAWYEWLFLLGVPASGMAFLGWLAEQRRQDKIVGSRWAQWYYRRVKSPHWVDPDLLPFTTLDLDRTPDWCRDKVLYATLCGWRVQLFRRNMGRHDEFMLLGVHEKGGHVKSRDTDLWCCMHSAFGSMGLWN